MNRRIATAILLVGSMIDLTCWARPNNVSDRHVALPNPDLLGCTSFGCSQLWLDESGQADAIYPVNISVDISAADTCPRGIVALYDKSVSTADIQAALDQRYGKWAQVGNATSTLKLWRVEPAKFAIQLATIGEGDGGATLGQALAGKKNRHGDTSHVGMKQVIYLAFTGEKCKQ